MTPRTAVIGLSGVVAALAAVSGLAIARPPAQGDDQPESVSTGAIVSIDPTVTIHDASPSQMARIGQALAAFASAGLELPELSFEFHEVESACGDALGHFDPSASPWRIRICSTDIRSVYEHELAHAWERANLTDTQRRSFMEHRDHSHWSDEDGSWMERGVEGVAFVIQQGVAGLPLPPALGTEAISRLEAYELLTGKPAPTLVDWLESRDVPCDERPTPRSVSIADGDGTRCERRPHHSVQG